MDKAIDFLSGGSNAAIIIGTVIALGPLIIIVLTIVGFWQGREIALWPPKIGPRPLDNAGYGGAARMGDSQSISWIANSRTVEERDAWLSAGVLVIGVQYSPKFFKDFFDVIESRCQQGRATLGLVLEPGGEAARYLSATNTGWADVARGVAEIERLLAEADKARGYARLKKHDRVMRYSFIRTDDVIWVKFFTNAPYRTLVPAVRIAKGCEHFEFFENDIRMLEEASA